MPKRKMLTGVVAIILCWPMAAVGQPDTAAPDPLGVWEGYNSYGYLLRIEIVGNPDASITALTQSYLYGAEGGASFSSQVFEIETVGPTLTRFSDLATATSVDGHWYGPDALRLVFADGSIAIMARVLNTEAAAAGNPFAALPPVTTPPEAEGLMRALEGMWEMTATEYEGAIPTEGTAEIRVVDVPTGQIMVTTSLPLGVTTEYYQVVSATVDSLAVRTTYGYDTPIRIKFAEPDRVEFVQYGLAQMVLQRLTVTPPE